MRPFHNPLRGPARDGRLLALSLLALAVPTVAAGQWLEPLHFPAPVPVAVVVAAAGAAEEEEEDPPSLGPPPPHHTRNAVLWTAGLSVGVFGVLLLLPEEITRWSADDRSWHGLKEEFDDWKRHVTAPPVWDNDHWYLNYVAHPYVGMNTYLMERNYGRSPLRSFLFSTAASVAWEYGPEAMAERPSIQDLLVTSPVGSVLGELNYRLTHHLRRGGLTTTEKVILTIINPIHVIQHGYR